MNSVELDSGSAPAGAAQNDFNSEDERFMRLALALGRRGLGNTWPNPAVGAVVVKDGVVLGRGWTQPGGRPHAETEALRRAKRSARGATLYVTLEPCSHDGQTPPCADAVIQAGIKRVVCALEDPNPQVAGQGYAKLRASGIQVDTGLLADEARRAHAGHIAKITQARPHVLLKMALSSDEKVGFAGNKRAFITGDDAQARVHMMRAKSDAVLTGIGTVLADNPQLTCRLPGMFERSPIRVVLDANLRTPLSLGVISTVRETPTWVFCATGASEMAEEILVHKGAKVFRVPETNGKLDLGEVLKTLAAEGITRLMVEAGPRVAASFVGDGLVDEVALLRAPKPLGEGSLEALDGMALSALTEGMSEGETEEVGEDTLTWYEKAQ